MEARAGLRFASQAEHVLQLLGPKTARSRRSIALPAQTVEALKAEHVAQKGRRLLLGPAYEDEYGPLVVCHEDGSPWWPASFSKTYMDFRKADSVRARFHDLRRSHGSQLLKAGVPIKVVSERLGHASAAFTMDVYTDVLDGMQEDAAARIDAMLGAAIRDAEQEAVGAVVVPLGHKTGHNGNAESKAESA